MTFFNTNLINDTSQLNSYVDKFHNYLVNCYNECVPLKRIKVRNDEPPGINNKIRSLALIKNQSYKKKQTIRYLTTRETLAIEILQAKQFYYANRFNECNSA